MALSTLVRAEQSYSSPGYYAVNLSTPWITAVTAGGPAATDNSTNRILTPIASITAATRRAVSVPPWATHILIRMGYDATTNTISASPVVQVFGFDSETIAAPFVQLQNEAGTPAEEVTLTGVVADDMSDGTYKYTEVLQTVHRLNLLGSRVVLVGVKTAFAVSGGGTAATSFIQIKAVNFGG